MIPAPTFVGFPASPAGLAWQSIAIDRSQATGAAFNLNTISRGGGGDATTATRWSVKTGIGAEAAAMHNGLLCNSVGGASWRALLYSLPLRSQAPLSGEVDDFCDTVILDTLIDAMGLNPDTGVFLMQTDGTVAGTALPSAGGAGFGFLPNGGGIFCWTSNLGIVGAAMAPFAGSLCRCRLTVTSARRGQAGRFQMAVNGTPVASGLLDAAVGNGPNQGYQAGKSSYWPVVSCGGGGVLFVAALTILSATPGYL